MLRILIQALKIFSVGAMALVVLVAGQRFFDFWVERETGAEVGRPAVVRITEEDVTGTIAEKLEAAGLINSQLYFQTRLRFSDGIPQPGTYTLHHGMSVVDIIDEITIPVTDTGEAAEAPVGLEVTTIEGWRMEQFATELEAVGLEDGAEEFLMAASDMERHRDQWDFLADLPSGVGLEGYLFPSTYEFGSDAGGYDLVGLMLSTFDDIFTPQMREQAADQGLTIHEVLTLASIVEKEAAVAEERPIIAAVYLNRLRNGMPLQADPTVQYVIGTPQEWWPQVESGVPASEAATGPYNTYQNEGLPPGPISAPGIASIQAVLNPADVDDLYFVAVGDGTHVFADTYEEHQQNVCTYLGC